MGQCHAQWADRLINPAEKSYEDARYIRTRCNEWKQISRARTDSESTLLMMTNARRELRLLDTPSYQAARSRELWCSAGSPPGLPVPSPSF